MFWRFPKPHVWFGTYTEKEHLRKELRKELQDVSVRCPESPAGSLYWALFLLNESKFDKAVYSTVAAELKSAAVHGSLLGLVLYARIIPELNASSSPDAALLNARVETCIKSAIENGWLLPETAGVLRKGSLQAIAKLPVP